MDSEDNFNLNLKEKLRGGQAVNLRAAQKRTTEIAWDPPIKDEQMPFKDAGNLANPCPLSRITVTDSLQEVGATFPKIS